MKRKTVSILAFTLAASVSLCACTSAKVVAENDTVIESSYVEEVKDNKITSNDLAFMVLLDEYYKSGKSVEEILSPEAKSNVLYCSALYVKLREFGLSDEIIKEELYNVINFGLVHPMPDGWKNDLLVKNLNESLNYSTDAICYYYPLASFIHLFDCRLVHDIVDEERIVCDKIQEDLMAMNENVLFYNYVIENVLAMEDDSSLKVALNRILNSKEDPKVCMEELENIYKLGMIPRCATEEEWDSIIHLRKTIGEEENPFEVYYDLATFAHTLRCEEEHYQNEFGQWECPSIRQEMENGMSLGK